MDLSRLVDEEKFFPIISTLSECLCTELDKAGGPDLCFCGIFVGDIAPLALMKCGADQCGVAWVRPGPTYPSTTFPLQADPSALLRCGAPLAMTLEVGVARCAPRATNGQLYPDPQDTFDSARLYMSDMQAMRRAICCLKKMSGVLYSMQQWSPIPVQGGVSGGTWTLVVG